jgi:hypothetical protein
MIAHQWNPHKIERPHIEETHRNERIRLIDTPSVPKLLSPLTF